MSRHTDVLDTPIGRLGIRVDDDGALVALDYDCTCRPAPASAARCAAVRRELTEFFAGRRRAFDLRLRPAGSAFQQRVWRTLQQVPYGEVESYGWLAARLGSSARAVGRANATNPIAIVVPCHRIIGADGSLTGYGGGLERKRWLLEFEGALTPQLL